MMADLTEVDLPLAGLAGAGAKHPGQSQAGAEGADLEEGAAVDAVAVAPARSPKCEHGRNPPNWFRNRLPAGGEETDNR